MTSPVRRCGCRALLAALLALAAGCGVRATLTGTIRDGVLDRRLDAIRADEVRVVRPGVGLLSPPPLHLREGDEISTGRSIEVVLRFANSTYVLLRPNTHVTINCVVVHQPEPATDEGEHQEAGRSWLGMVGEIIVKARSRFRTGTDWVDGEVKGTRYLLRVARNGETMFRVFEGTVGLRSRRGAWGDVDVHAGEEASMQGLSAPEKRPISPGDMTVLDAAFEAFDRLLDLGGAGG